MGRVNAKRIVANVIRDLDLEGGDYRFDAMLEWALEAALLIGTRDTFIRKECEIDIANHKALLPKDFYKLISVKSGDGYLETTNRDFIYFYKDSLHLATGKTDTVTPQKAVTKFYIDGSYINFTSKTGTVGLSYFSFPVDDEGMPLIKESLEIAATAYVIYAYVRSKYFGGKLPNHVYREAKRRWEELCANARGKDAMPNRRELDYIGAIMNNLLPFPSQNRF